MRSSWILLLAALAVATSCGQESESASPDDFAPATPQPGTVDVEPRFDALWDAAPEAGKANLRILLTVDGKPLSLATGLLDRYRLTILPESGGSLHMEEFTPDGRSRFVRQGQEPGTYSVEVKHARKAYAVWSRIGIVLEAGQSLLLEVPLK